MENNHVGEDLDVIVIGAGLSGLTSVQFLLERDPSLRILILEASDRVGGRLAGVPVQIANSDQPKTFDFGGEWLLDDQKNVLELLDRLKLQTFSDYNSSYSDTKSQYLKKLIQVGRKGKVRQIDASSPSTLLPSRPSRDTGIRSWMANLELMYLIWKLDRISRQISMANPYSYTSSTNPDHYMRHARGLDSISVEAYLVSNTRFQSVRDVITIKCRFMCGKDPSSISMLFLLAYANSQAGGFSNFLYGRPSHEGHDHEKKQLAKPLKVVHGAWQICERLQKTFADKKILRLNEPVQGIASLDVDLSKHKENSPSFRTPSAYVTTKTGSTYKCKHVICAVPPNMLSQIEFSPPLPPAKRHIINSMSMGSYIKFVLTYDEAYWLNTGYSGDLVSAGGFQKVSTLEGEPITVLCDGTTYDGVPALVGFLGGRLAVQWGQKGIDALKSTVLENLSKYFGTWAREPVAFFIKDWSDETFLGGGGVCAPVVGSMHSFYTLRQPCGSVHFAGTETAVDYYGSMSGAIQVRILLFCLQSISAV